MGAGYSLRPAANNRLFLSLRSGISSEIDWALDQLVHLSHQSRISLADFPGSVEALLDIIDTWLEDMEDLEKLSMASDALLILRNCTHAASSDVAQRNIDVLLWVKQRPATTPSEETVALAPRILYTIQRLLDLSNSSEYPEPALYMIDILVSATPALLAFRDEQPLDTEPTSASLTWDLATTLWFTTLAPLILTTGDLGLVIPLLQLYTLVPTELFPPAFRTSLLIRLQHFLLLSPSVGEPHSNPHTPPSPYPPDLLLHTLSLLYTLTSSTPPATCREILESPRVQEWLQVLVRCCEWNSRETEAELGQHTNSVQGVWVTLGQPGTTTSATTTTATPPAAAIRASIKQDDGGDYTGESVGLGPVIRMSDEKRRKIRQLKEPERALAW